MLNHVINTRQAYFVTTTKRQHRDFGILKTVTVEADMTFRARHENKNGRAHKR